MNIDAFKAAITSKTARQVLLAQKHSPKILFVAGTVGVVGTVVLACRATLKVADVLDEHEYVQKQLANQIEPKTGQPLTDDETNQVQRKHQVKTILDITKLYAPAVGLGALSIGALTGSHVILTNRNAGLAATLAAVHTGYMEYRQRVTEELGADKDREFAYGSKNIEVLEDTTKGTKSTTKSSIDSKGFGKSPYAVVFDENSRFFTKEPGMNANILMMKQNWANEKLRAQGHLFLNEVLDMLGLPRKPIGQQVGWVWRRDSEPKNGDNYVSFGVFDGDMELVESFFDGSYYWPVLDFNVDGYILDKI